MLLKLKPYSIELLAKSLDIYAVVAARAWHWHDGALGEGEGELLEAEKLL